MVPLERLTSGSSASMPGASPEASCHDAVGAPLSFFLFFESGSAEVAESLLSLTTDHAPAAGPDPVPEAAGATVLAGVSGSAGLGAGVHAGSLGGFGVGSGAGRNGSTGAGVYGSAVAGGKSHELGAGAGAGGGTLGVSHGGGDGACCGLEGRGGGGGATGGASKAGVS